MTQAKGTFQPVKQINILFYYYHKLICSFSHIQDSDVHITYEDQQKINKFARLNAKMDDFKDEMKFKEVIH